MYDDDLCVLCVKRLTEVKSVVSCVLSSSGLSAEAHVDVCVRF